MQRYRLLLQQALLMDQDAFKDTWFDLNLLKRRSHLSDSIAYCRSTVTPLPPPARPPVTRRARGSGSRIQEERILTIQEEDFQAEIQHVQVNMDKIQQEDDPRMDNRLVEILPVVHRQVLNFRDTP